MGMIKSVCDATVLALLLALAAGTAAVSAQEASAGTARVLDRSATPALYSCAGRALRTPRHFNLACGDGNGYYDRMHWRHWGHRYAAGHGRQWYNTCNPNCAAGHYKLYKVRVRLDQVRTKNGHGYFSRIRINRPARAPHRQYASTPAP